MRTVYIFFGAFLLSVLLVTDGLAQQSATRWSNYDAVITSRIGTQGVNLGELNQALQQAGYGSLPARYTTLSMASQLSKPNRALAFNSALGLSFNQPGTSVSNGTNGVSANFYYIKFGASYRVIHTDKFQLATQLGGLFIPFRLQISQKKTSNPPSLNSILIDPGNAQTATLNATSVGADAGLLASLRIPTGKRQMDCLTIEQSFTISLDAGYRFATRAPLISAYTSGANNPTIQLSGWYAGIHIGLGSRVRSTIDPATL